MSMLTIKHVEKCGREGIVQAHQVSFWPQGQEGEEPAGKPMLQAFGCTGEGPLGGYLCFKDGTVYVMNDAGSTVGNYHLS